MCASPSSIPFQLVRLLGHARWLLLLLASLVPGAAAAEDTSAVEVYVFWARGCPHCERELDFLRRLQADRPAMRLHLLEVTRNSDHRRLFIEISRALRIEEPGVPLTIIGNQAFEGYYDDELTGAQLRKRVDTCLAQGCPDSVKQMLSGTGAPGLDMRAPGPLGGKTLVPLPETIHVPMLGEVALRELSLPALTVLLAGLDGFNPCAMWTLVFLIGLLLGMKDRVRMWALGTAFIAGSAAVYFMFMAAWLNLLLFIGSLPLVRAAIGLLAVGGGLYYLRQFVVNREEVCKVTAPEQRQRVFTRLRNLTRESSFLVALLGILTLAFLVNLVELICSAGIPVVYTQALAMSNLQRWQYHAYLVLYILVFMLDDLIVFVGAMATLRLTGLSTRYSRYAHLVGGAVLLGIGAVMLLRPEWLLFG